MESPSTKNEAAVDGAAVRQRTVGDAGSRPPWSEAELERLAAEEDRRAAEARERQSRGLEPYADPISAEDLRGRADKLRPAAATAP